MGFNVLNIDRFLERNSLGTDHGLCFVACSEEDVKL